MNRLLTIIINNFHNLLISTIGTAKANVLQVKKPLPLLYLLLFTNVSIFYFTLCMVHILINIQKSEIYRPVIMLLNISFSSQSP